MKIQAFTNQHNTNFQAINKHYYDWAVREKKFRHNYGELMRMIRYETHDGTIPVQDGIDTLIAIRDNLAPESWHESIQRSIDLIKGLLE